jgi:uncharacterized delta-60 repeat protein
LQPDGKLVAAGQSCQVDLCDFALARYLPDGNLDPTFGVGGKVTTDFELLDDPNALILQPDGKLVAAAEIFDGSSSDFGLVRYLPNRSLDPTFGVGGKVRTDFGGFDLPAALIVQPDGKLVAAGSAFGDFALARYLPDGSLDSAFGLEGLVMTGFDGDDQALDLVRQPDGKLVAAGRAAGEFALARYVEQQPVFNDFVTFEPLPATFHFTPDPTGCPEGFVGTFSCEARLANISDRALSELVIEVIALTFLNLLQNADGGPGGVGARLTVPRQDGFTDGVLTPDEFMDVPFIICLTTQEPFRLVVDVLGEAE